jgi:hypothetical protein
MKLRRFACALIAALLTLSTAARADVLVPGQKPPRNEYSEAFVKLYADQIVAWDSAYENALDGVEEIVLWQYPNSGQRTRTIDADWFRNDERGISGYFDACYVDGQGRFWVYVGYAYGRQMAWACLSEPANPNLPADPEVTAAVEREVGAMLWWENAPAIILVAGIVAVTGALIYVFWYRGKRVK